MKKNKAAYVNFVCYRCFRQLNKCICEDFPPYSLILIDERIQPVIQLLHDKGYITTGCCESHYQGVCDNIYVTFNKPMDFDSLPDGFKYIKQRYGIGFNYPRKIEQQKFEELKNEKLAELLRWAKEL